MVAHVPCQELHGTDPVSQRDWDDAHLINAALDAHHDDPEFGYRFIADELTAKGLVVGRNRVNRLCTLQRIFSVHSRRLGLNRNPGPPVHEDLVERQFVADQPDRLWLTRTPSTPLRAAPFPPISEQPTGEGKLPLCAVKDACSTQFLPVRGRSGRCRRRVGLRDAQGRPLLE